MSEQSNIAEAIGALTLTRLEEKAVRTLLADHARLEAENARLRETCQPFAKAWAMGCRVLRHNGKVHEVASRASLGLTEDGALQVGDFERLVRALTNREGQDNG